MSDEIRVVLDRKLTQKSGIGEDGKVHTRYYVCARGEPGADDELLLHLAVPLAQAEAALFLRPGTPEERADEFARLKADEAFYRHDRGEDA